MAPESSTTEQLAFGYAAGDIVADKYALEELLGEGGMGAVFRARNLTIDMPVAVKLIRSDLDREVLSGRLLQEARAAAKLAHPAIVRVFDVGKTALGDPFIVMELLHGETLASVIVREGRLSSARAVQLLLPIADALSVAHAKGFVHRDVKPDNVFIANDNEGQLQPKLVDFGIVKHEHPDGNSQVTQRGAVLGSPEYMSPEQARGLENIDQRSDVWAFSVVLYEAITGTVPFQSPNYNALLRMVLETEPLSLRQHNVTDDELSQIVQQGLSKDPADRFATMGLMGKALAAWLSGQGICEDVCGVSLETRWLSRQTDPAALGRASRSSFPDGWPEPPSGVRVVSGKFGNAATVPLTQLDGTPDTVAPSWRASSVQTRHLLLGVAAVAIMAALVFGYFEVVRSPAPRETAGASAPARGNQQAASHKDLQPAPSPLSSVSAAPPKPSALLTPKAASNPAPPRPRLHEPAAIEPPSPEPILPNSDLLVPY